MERQKANEFPQTGKVEALVWYAMTYGMHASGRSCYALLLNDCRKLVPIDPADLHGPLLHSPWGMKVASHCTCLSWTNSLQQRSARVHRPECGVLVDAKLGLRLGGSWHRDIRELEGDGLLPILKVGTAATGGQSSYMLTRPRGKEKLQLRGSWLLARVLASKQFRGLGLVHHGRL